MSLALRRSASIPRRFPRVSGDEPDFLRTIVQFAEFSPRERG